MRDLKRSSSERHGALEIATGRRRTVFDRHLNVISAPDVVLIVADVALCPVAIDESVPARERLKEIVLAEVVDIRRFVSPP